MHTQAPPSPLPWRNSVALAAALSAASIAGCNNKEGLAQLPAVSANAGAREVRVKKLATTMDTDVVRATGTTTALSTTKVMPLVPGLIRTIPVKEGDRVKKGQTLAVLDQRGFKLTLQQAQAAVEGAKVGLDALTRERDRFAKLYKQQATARAQYDQILDKYKGAKVQLKAARIMVAQAKKALADTVLKAPYTGAVVKKLASVGDYATAMPPTVLMILMQTTTLELLVSLPEPELPRVNPEDKVEVEFRSLKRTIRTKVARVVPSVDPITRSFSVIIELDNRKMILQPGLFARVRISTGQPRGRLLLPKEAVLDEGNGVYVVFILDGNKARRQEVHVTVAGQDHTEALSGLREGQQAILDPSGLFDGDLVKVGQGTPK